MKINIVGSGSIGADMMSASYILDEHILIDVPNGIVKHVSQLGHDILKIDTILITHLHGDHFFDLPFFLLKKYFNHDKTPVKIICPKGTIKKTKELFRLGFPYNFRKVMNNVNIEFIEHKGSSHLKLGEYLITSRRVKHGKMTPAFGYIIHKKTKSIGFSGDSMYCPAVDKIVEEADISILDMSLKGEGDNSHMGYLDIQKICNKHQEKTIIATHMHNRTREVALNNPIKNLIVPLENEEINIE